MDWEEAINGAKEELGYFPGQYIRNWNELIEKAHEIQEDSNQYEKEERSFEAKINHQEYLKSERWIKLRQEVLKRDNFICVDCKKTCTGSILTKHGRATEVHHTTYASLGTSYEINDCISLCNKHHKERHNLQ